MKIKKSVKKCLLRLVTAVILCFLMTIPSYSKDVETIPSKGVDFANPIHSFICIQTPPNTTDWNLILVNPKNYLKEDFNVNLSKIISNGKVHYVDERILDDLKEMFNDMNKKGLNPVICSSYRTLSKQKTLYTNKVNYYLNLGYSTKTAKYKASTWVAIPGTSEHHTGLALDIVDSSYCGLDKNQENTQVQKWLMKNSYKYGFILRYPENKMNITGINYEPWHYRYVGKDNAKVIYENNLTLEEYIEDITENNLKYLLNI